MEIEEKAAINGMYVQLVEVKGWLTYLVSQFDDGPDRDNTLVYLAHITQTLARAEGKIL